MLSNISPTLQLTLFSTLASLLSACGVPEGDVKSTLATVIVERDGVQYDHWIYEDLSAHTTLRESFDGDGAMLHGPIFSYTYDEASYQELVDRLVAIEASGFQNTHAPTCTYQYSVGARSLPDKGGSISMRYSSCQDGDENALTLALEDIIFDGFEQGELDFKNRQQLEEQPWSITRQTSP